MGVDGNCENGNKSCKKENPDQTPDRSPG